MNLTGPLEVPLTGPLVRQARDATTFLFVPGHKPNVIQKALSSAADGVIFDLEDSVPPGEKDLALDRVLAHESMGRLALVRVNGPIATSVHPELDHLAGREKLVMLPKATADQFEIARRAWPRLGFIALIETAVGVSEASLIAAQPQVIRLALGHLDLAVELGIDPDDRTALHYARSTLVVASAANGLPAPLDGVTRNISEPGVAASDAAYAKALGFGGKLAVHPRQLAAIRDAFRPSPEELRWAEDIVRGAGSGATGVSGQMVDAPVLARARYLLERHRR